MAIEKRVSKTGKTTYRVRLRLRGQGDVSATCARLTDAKDLEAQAKTRLRSGTWDGAGESKRRTVAEMIDRYLALLPTMQLKDERNRQRHAEWWRQQLGQLSLAEITPVRIAAVRDALLVGKTAAMQTQSGGPRSSATVVRYLAALSAILSVAVDDWGWLSDNPLKRVRKPKQPDGRVRYLSDVELPALLEACRCSSSTALYAVVVLALATAMRRGEILSLRWRQVDLLRGLVTLERTKNGRRRQLPLVGHAAEVLAQHASGDRGPDDFVFAGQRQGKPVDITKAWSTAVQKAGIHNFRFHDLRHTAASYLAMRGASLLAIGEILGHRSMQMTQRYSHLSTSHTRAVLTGMVNDVLPATSAATPLLLSD